MKLLIIGPARHGKDTFAEGFAYLMNSSFVGSSEWVGRRYIWPLWGSHKYETYEEMFEDRVNWRPLWREMIISYNEDATRLARELYAEHDIYVGMRSYREFKAAKEAKLFDYCLWIEAPERVGTTDVSLDIPKEEADIILCNDGPESDIPEAVHSALNIITSWKQHGS